MKKGISWFTFPNNLTTEERFRLAKKAGFDGIEILPVKSKKEASEIKKLAYVEDIKIPSIIETVNWEYPLSSNNQNIREKSSIALKDDIFYASIIGADTVLCVPGVVTENTTYYEAYQRSLKEIDLLAEYAEEYKVNLAIENVWNKFLLSPIEFAKFIDEINNPYVKAYFDCGNICLYGYPQDWIKYLGRKRIAKIHVKGFLDYPNEIGFPKTLISDVPWPKIMQALRKIEYNDYLTVEIKSNKDTCIDDIYRYSKELSDIINEKF